MKLSEREQKIVSLLKSGKIVSEKRFIEECGIDGNTLETAISRLRKKITPKLIFAHYGRGYSFRK